jgi:hypothetical protein
VKVSGQRTNLRRGAQPYIRSSVKELHSSRSRKRKSHQVPLRDSRRDPSQSVPPHSPPYLHPTLGRPQEYSVRNILTVGPIQFQGWPLGAAARGVDCIPSGQWAVDDGQNTGPNRSRVYPAKVRGAAGPISFRTLPPSQRAKARSEGSRGKRALPDRPRLRSGYRLILSKTVRPLVFPGSNSTDFS